MLVQLFLSLTASLRTRLAREEGQTMAEYGILLGVIVLVVAIAAVIFGNVLISLFDKFDYYISWYAPWRNSQELTGAGRPREQAADGVTCQPTPKGRDRWQRSCPPRGCT